MHNQAGTTADFRKEPDVPYTPPNENHSPFSASLLDQAIQLVIETGQANYSVIQRKLRVGYARANDLLTEMEDLGVIGPEDGVNPREVLMTYPQWLDIQQFQANKKETDIPDNVVPISMSHQDLMSEIDRMTGLEFEHWCGEILRNLGYQNVRVTQSSGDQGVDILAEKDGVRFAFQCKRYSGPLGNTPVQEVAAGRDYYGCHVGVVMTNSSFTAGGIELAEKVNVLLWDRNTLADMVKRAECQSGSERGQ